MTDQISDLLFTPSEDANENLINEGVNPATIRFVGNVMIDTLVKMLPKANDRPILNELHLTEGMHVLVTLHRPSNVDDPVVLRELLRALKEISRERPVVFPVHPRTRQRIRDMKFGTTKGTFTVVDPLGYLDFLALMKTAALVLTDSGGLQEETTFLGVPCLTARPNTERPVTVTCGTNQLVESRSEAILRAIRERLPLAKRKSPTPHLWDGHAAVRITEAMAIIQQPAS